MRTSATALNQYERCPYQYYQERIEKIKGKPTPPMQLGSVCHSTIARLMTKYLEDGEIKPFDAAVAAAFYKEEWAAESGISGEELFMRGLQMVMDFVERWSEYPLDPKSILGIEKHFEIFLTFEEGDNDDEELGPGITISGFMDLVLSDEEIIEDTGEVLRTIEVIDYKSAAFMTSGDAESSVQLAIYDIAARKLWPDATAYACALHLLQSGTHIKIFHDPMQLRGFRDYILATAMQRENDQTWITKLEPNCIWCHLRFTCPAYQKALSSRSHLASETTDDLERLAQERLEVGIQAKIYQQRLDEIDSVLEAALAMTKEPLILAGHVFKLSKVETLKYDPQTVVDLLSNKLRMDPKIVTSQTMKIVKKNLEALLTSAAKDHGLTQISLIKAALANKAERHYTTKMNPPRKIKETHKKRTKK